MIVGLGTIEGDGPVEQLDGGLEPAVLQSEHPQQEHDVGIVVAVGRIEPGIPVPGCEPPPDDPGLTTKTSEPSVMSEPSKRATRSIPDRRAAFPA